MADQLAPETIAETTPQLMPEFIGDPAPFDIESFVNEWTATKPITETADNRMNFSRTMEKISRPFLAQGYNSAAALNRGLAAFSSHLDAVTNYVAESTGMEKGGLFEKAAEIYEENAEFWKKRADKVGVTFFDEIISEAAGGFAPGVASFMLDVASGFTFPYMDGAWQAYSRDENPFAQGILEAAKTGTLHALFKVMGPLKKYLQAPAMGTVFGLQEMEVAEEGGKARAFAKGVGIGLAYSLTSPGGRLGLNEAREALREPTKAFIEKMKEERGSFSTEKKEEIAPIWYSKMERTLEQKLPGAGTPEQFKNMVDSWVKKGEIKAEELKWSGLDEWLATRSEKDQPGKVGLVKDIDRRVWHITTPSRAESVVSEGLKPELGVSREGTQYVSLNPESAMGLVRSIERMQSFKTDQEVIDWARKQGATEQEIQNALKSRELIANPKLEKLKTDPAELYLNLIEETSYTGKLVPLTEEIWKDFGRKFIGENGVSIIEGKWKGELSEDFLRSSKAGVLEAGWKVSAPYQFTERKLVDLNQPKSGLALADGRITKQEVLDFVRSNQIEIKEVTKGLKDIGIAGQVAEKGGEPKFSQWQLPGGENYRELLLTLPIPKSEMRYWATDNIGKRFGPYDTEAEAWESADRHNGSVLQAPEFREGPGKSNVYTSSHWSEPNVLAHVRFNDRTGPNGEKILFLEEVQSDWHQEGRKEGYGHQKVTKDKINLVEENGTWRAFHKDTGEMLANASNTKEEALSMALSFGAEGVPPAPFSKTWHELAMKRMLRYAAENGYDRVAWTTGEQQVDRYIQAVKQFRKIYYNEATNELTGVHVDTGQKVTEIVPQEKLRDYIGKVPAEVLLAKETVDGVKTVTSNELGEYIKAGGEHLRLEYDTKIPAFLNKYAKKWGAMVEDTHFLSADKSIGEHIWSALPRDYAGDVYKFYESVKSRYPEDNLQIERDGENFTIYPQLRLTGTTVHSLPVTDSMRKSVMYGGQSMFGAIAGIDIDEEGNIIFDYDKSIAGMMFAMGVRRFGPGWTAKVRDAAAKSRLFKKEKLENFFNDAASVRKQLLDSGVAVEETIDPATGKPLYSPLKKNAFEVFEPGSREGVSVDFTSICAKRKSMESAITDRQKEIGRGLSPDELLALRQELKNAGEVVSCGACYVGRLQLGNIVNKISGLHPEVPKDLFFSQEGFDRMAVEYPKVWKELRSEMGVRQTKPPESYAEIDGQILKLPDYRITQLNDRRGMRWFSWSDFEIPHILDAMQAVGESAVKKLKAYAYTKVPDFVRTMGRTNMMINQSTMPKGATGLDAKGNLVWDDVEGMPIKTALKLRDEFPDTVGVELMGVSDAQIRKALSDERVDSVIPFHRSGLSEDLRNKYVQKGWKDYQGETEEKVAGTRSAPSREILDQIDWYNLRNANRKLSPKELAELYLKKCDELGVTPKFPEFRNESGYYKLLVDMKQTNHVTGEPIVQKILEPNFDVDFINKTIKQYATGKWTPYKTAPITKGQSVFLQSIKDRLKDQRGAFSLEKKEKTEPLKDENGEERKPRKFLKTIEESLDTAPELAAEVKKIDPQDYLVQPNKESLEKANGRINADLPGTIDYVLSDAPVSAEKGATFIALMEKFQREGDMDRAVEMVEAYDKQLREAGRFVQAASLWSNMTAPAFIRWANKQLNSVKEKYSWMDTLFRKDFKKKTIEKTGKSPFALSAEEQKYIISEFAVITKMPDSIEKSNKILDVIDVVAAKVPPSISEMIDSYRYQNMLSSPRTIISRNMGENIFNTFITRPVDITTRGAIDYVMAGLTGKEREAYVNDVPTYYKVAINSVPNAVHAFMETVKMSRSTTMEKPELGVEAKDAFQRARAKQMPTALTLVQRFMEASDKFNMAIIGAAEMAVQMKRGVPEAEAYKIGQETAQAYLYRSELKPGDPKLSYFSMLLSELGVMVKGTRQYRVLGPLSKLYVPFIMTPINKAIQMVEHSPLGAARGKMTQDAAAKIVAGSVVTALGGLMAYYGETTWAAPTNEEEKQWFYATGRKPFSAKIGDKWIPMWYLGPFALAFGIPAAIKYYADERRESITDDVFDKIISSVEGIGRFIGSQTSTQSIGALFSAIHGDMDFKFTSQTGFTAQQFIPAASLVRYINTIVDPVYRHPKGMIEGIEANLPFLSQRLEARMTPMLEESIREPINYVLPYDVGTTKEQYESMYPMIRMKAREKWIESQGENLLRKLKNNEITPEESITEALKIYSAAPKAMEVLE